MPTRSAADGVEDGVIRVEDEVGFHLIVEERADFNGWNGGDGRTLPLPTDPACVNDARDEFEQGVCDPGVV